MAYQLSRSSGSLSTNGTVVAKSGVLTFAQAIGGTASLYNGSTSGTLLATVTSSGYLPLGYAVEFPSTSGLYITLSAGTAVVHYKV
jgi:hypothetical protein